MARRQYTDAFRQRLREVNLGKKHSEATKAKMSASHQRRKKLLGYMNSPETREKISQSLTGKKVSEITKEKLRKINLGKKHTSETKEKMSLAQTGERNHQWGKRGKNSPGWKGGITILTEHIRRTFEYRQWRSDILTRDDFTCEDCEQRGGKLRAHHIKSFASIFELNNIKTVEQARNCDELWNINNGMTLCEECHQERHKKNE